jgi:hypothetical protein
MRPDDTDDGRLAARWKETLAAHLEAVPVSFRSVLGRALAWDAVDRHSSCEALADELDVLAHRLQAGESTGGAASEGSEKGKRRWFRRRR